MAEELPGFIPRVLQRGDVSLLRADEAVLEAMVDGWRAQMLARGLATSTITARCGLIGRFVEFTNEYPWRWRPLDLDQFLADLRSRETPIELSTLRSYSNAISMFCSYVSDSRYGWVPFCEKQFGDVPSQICFEWNTARHTTDDAVPTRRRAFTKTELQHFFDVVDDFVDEQHQAGSKRWLTALRDSIAFKIGYAYGLRRRELVMLDLTDFGPNPHVPRFGDYGAMTVRWAKGTKGSGPRRRTVLTVPEFPWAVELLQYWCTEGRQLLRTADRSPALWPSERGSRLTINALGRSFTALRARAGLPPELKLHCLRHSYTWRCALADLPCGGASGGIRIDPSRYSRAELERVTRRYTTEVTSLMGAEEDTVLPDLGTDDRTIAWITDTLSDQAGRSDVSVAAGRLPGLDGSRGREIATSRGIVQLALAALHEVDIVGTKATAVVEGYGK